MLLSVSSANAATKRTVQASSVAGVFAAERPGAGQQRTGKVQQPPPLLVERKRRAQWRAFAIIVAQARTPSAAPSRGAEQAPEPDHLQRGAVIWVIPASQNPCSEQLIPKNRAQFRNALTGCHEPVCPIGAGAWQQ